MTRWPAPLLLLLVAAAPGPHKVTRNTSALEFHYEWPAEAAAIPKLDLILYTKAKAELAKAQSFAAEEQAAAKADKREFHQQYFDAGWQLAGNTPRLIALEYGDDTFQGGAHPNHVFRAMLWDKALGREIPIDSLFARANAFAELTRAPYCKALDKDRLERREGEKIGGQYDECPKYAELAIAPLDKDKDGRFDAIRFVASPYIAGPYVEGEYEVELAVTRQLVAALKPVYRDVFEVHRQ